MFLLLLPLHTITITSTIIYTINIIIIPYRQRWKTKGDKIKYTKDTSLRLGFSPQYPQLVTLSLGENCHSLTTTHKN
jgi:hypothetical protein